MLLFLIPVTYPVVCYVLCFSVIVNICDEFNNNNDNNVTNDLQDLVFFERGLSGPLYKRQQQS